MTKNEEIKRELKGGDYMSADIVEYESTSTALFKGPAIRKLQLFQNAFFKNHKKCQSS